MKSHEAVMGKKKKRMKMKEGTDADADGRRKREKRGGGEICGEYHFT